MKFRGDIEGLRAVAVIVVVLFHCGVSMFGGGYIGVDVFFVLSGFLITSLMLGEIGSTSGLSFAGFYGRRARRLLPAATMVIAATVLVGWFVLSPLARRDLVGDALSATTYTVNWRFAVESTDYFQSELAPSALQHYWSLAVEEQFYVIWPLAIWLLAGRRLHRGRLVAGLGVVVVASFVVSVVVTTRSQPWAFFGLHTRMWQLGSGALLAVLWPRAERIARPVRHGLAAAGVIAVLGSVMVFDSQTRWPGTAALVPTLGTLAVIMGGNSGPVAAVLGRGPLVWIGARSYSWYLWHWPALILFAAWRERPTSTPTAIAVALGALAIGHVGYTLVEQPIRHGRRLVQSSGRSIAVGLTLSVTCLLALVIIRPTAQHVDATGAVADAATVPPIADLPALLEDAATATDVPANLHPSLAEARDDLPVVYPMGCHADIPVVEPTICELGDPDGSATAVLIGDSHAAQWVPALDTLAAEAGIRLIPMTKSGCPVFDVPVFNSMLNRVYGECDDWRANVFEAMAAMQPDLIVVTQSSLFSPADTDRADAPEVIRHGYERSLATLSDATGTVLVLSDTPYPVGDVPDCLSAHLGDATACTSERTDAFANRLTEIEQQAAEAAGARYVDLDDLVCGPTSCPVVVGDLLVYRDNSHLSTDYVRWVTPALAELLGEPWLPASP